MIDQPNLFTYPQRPGWKRTDTSKAAADDMAPLAPTLRRRVWDFLRERPWGMTADEVARFLNADILAIRPRFSELRKMGWVKDSGRRGTNSSHKTAIIWEATRPAGCDSPAP